MPRTVTVGLDGSPESRTAAEWAAREAKLRELPLKVVHVWEPVPEPIAQAPLLGPETHQHWTERIPREVPREAAAGLRAAHPEVELRVEQVTGRPADVLIDAARDGELLVLGRHLAARHPRLERAAPHRVRDAPGPGAERSDRSGASGRRDFGTAAVAAQKFRRWTSSRTRGPGRQPTI